MRAPVSSSEKNLELNVGMACNNRCVFCMSGDVASSERRWLPLERAKEELRHFYGKGCRSLGFLGGEPTAYPHLLECIGYARSLGYQRIALCSNGTKFSDPDFVRDVIDAGTTRFTVSIHSHTAEMENALTGLPGNFDRKLKGLRLLREYREKGRLPDNVSLNPVLNKKTLSDLEAYIEFFRGEGFDDIRFNYIWPQSRVRRDRDMIPRYREAMPEILRVILLNERRWKMHLTFGGIPICMLRWGKAKLSPKLAEHLGSRYLSESDDLPTQVSLQGRERFNWQDRKKNMLKTHRKGCEKCRYAPVCEGVWKTYAELYDLDELVPVEPARKRRPKRRSKAR